MKYTISYYHNEIELVRVDSPELKNKIERAFLRNRISYFIRWDKVSFWERLFGRKEPKQCKICINDWDKEKALEINTAALRQPLNKLSPDIDIIKRFKELGGKYVTVGSDAHFAEHLASDIDMAYSAALEAGFDSITFFQKRIPMQMKIEIEE